MRSLAERVSSANDSVSLLKAAESASGTAPGDEVGAGERPDPCR